VYRGRERERIEVRVQAEKDLLTENEGPGRSRLNKGELA
jgi:hypothetical protein